MFRWTIAFSIVAVSLVASPDSSCAQPGVRSGARDRGNVKGPPKSIKVAPNSIAYGEMYEGELTEDQSTKNSPRNVGVGGGPGGRVGGYVTTLPLAMNAGKSLTISASVTGTSRMVGIALLDSTGAVISQGKMNVKTAKIDVKEIPANGVGTIVIQSDKIGPFKLLVVDPDADDDAIDEPTVQSLKDKIAKLESELEVTKRKLAELEMIEKKRKTTESR